MRVTDIGSVRAVFPAWWANVRLVAEVGASVGLTLTALWIGV